MKTITPNALDEFLGNATPQATTTPLAGAPVPVNPLQPLHTINDGMSTGNNIIEQVVRLVEGINNLGDKFGFFDTSRKEQRLALDSSYDMPPTPPPQAPPPENIDYEALAKSKDKQPEKPKEQHTKNVSVAVEVPNMETQAINLYAVVVEALTNTDKEKTAKELLDELTAEGAKEEFIKLLKEILAK